MYLSIAKNVGTYLVGETNSTYMTFYFSMINVNNLIYYWLFWRAFLVCFLRHVSSLL